LSASDVNFVALPLLRLHWQHKTFFLALILPQIAMGIPVSIFLLRGFMKDIPHALLESARIDGSTEMQNLYHIIVPMLYPPIV
jgi:ABC-type glycerol-3-phosphate transport system permease component